MFHSSPPAAMAASLDVLRTQFIQLSEQPDWMMLLTNGVSLSCEPSDGWKTSAATERLALQIHEHDSNHWRIMELSSGETIKSGRSLNDLATLFDVHELIHDFRLLAQNHDLKTHIERHFDVNFAWKTLGGTVFWTSFDENGWKLQVNIFTGHWRILDEQNVRQAWGVEWQSLKRLLLNQGQGPVRAFFDCGNTFWKYPAQPHHGKNLFLLHGLGTNATFMEKLCTALVQQGYTAYSYDYRSSQLTIQELANAFLTEFRAQLAAIPPQEEIYILTHSMGGILFRAALPHMTPDEIHRISAVVMLAPPNRGSVWGDFGKLAIVKNFNKPLEELNRDYDSFVNSIPAPAAVPPIGIIAGEQDGKVSVKDTMLPDGIPFQHVILPASHPALRNPTVSLQTILMFFLLKHF